MFNLIITFRLEQSGNSKNKLIKSWIPDQAFLSGRQVWNDKGKKHYAFFFAT